MKRLLLLTLLLSNGCGHPGRVRVGETDFTPPKNAETHSTVSSNTTTTETDLPAGTKKTVTKTDATATSPAKEETVYEFTQPTKETVKESNQDVVIANERPPDRSVEMFNAKADEREPLLWIAIGLGVVGLIVAAVLKYPVIGMQISGLGGGGAFAAWKFAEVPGWICAVGCVTAFFSWAFYIRGQWDKDGDGIPDALQKKSP